MKVQDLSDTHATDNTEKEKLKQIRDKIVTPTTKFIYKILLI